MKIQESAENYLESVLILQKQKGHVRSIDIVNYLGFLKAQRQRGYEKSSGKWLHSYG